MTQLKISKRDESKIKQDKPNLKNIEEQKEVNEKLKTIVTCRKELKAQLNQSLIGRSYILNMQMLRYKDNKEFTDYYIDVLKILDERIKICEEKLK